MVKQSAHAWFSPVFAMELGFPLFRCGTARQSTAVCAKLPLFQLPSSTQAVESLGKFETGRI